MALRSGRSQVLIRGVGVDILPGLAEVPVDLVIGAVLPDDVQDVLDRRLASGGDVRHGVVRAAELCARVLDRHGNESAVCGEVLVMMRNAVPALLRASNP